MGNLIGGYRMWVCFREMAMHRCRFVVSSSSVREKGGLLFSGEDYVLGFNRRRLGDAERKTEMFPARSR
jgi:hypothetical protein